MTDPITDEEQRILSEIGEAVGPVYLERHGSTILYDHRGAVVEAVTPAIRSLFARIDALTADLAEARALEQDAYRYQHAAEDRLTKALAQVDALRGALWEMLGMFTDKATIGEAVVRTGWLYPRNLDRFRALGATSTEDGER